jgi:hypothetical protein
MRSICLAALIPALAFAAGPLTVVKPVISQFDDGIADPPGFEHIPGETIHFACRVANFATTEDAKYHLAYSVQPFDPKGVPLVEIYKNEVTDEISPQDKNWLPKIDTEMVIPPLVRSGTYKIVVKVEDLVAKTTAQLEVPFEVRGHAPEPSAQLVVRDFRFFADENATRPLEKAVYHPGASVWAKFDITGFKYGAGNKIDVSYVTSLVAASGRVLWTQPEPAAEQSESFYPKSYITADFGINLANNIRPGEYSIVVAVKDAVGGQSYETKQTFTVE